MLQKVVAWKDEVCRPNVLYIDCQKMANAYWYFIFWIYNNILAVGLVFLFYSSVVIFFGDTGISW